ncbi:MAG: DUF2304 domain-containing protein [Syntrophobacter sp.]
MQFDYITIRFLSLCIIGYIAILIHNHRLKIGYSWFLLLLSAGLLLLSIWPGSLTIMKIMTGDSSLIINSLFMLTLFLVAITIHTSLISSDLMTRVKELSQEIALLKSDIADMHFPFNSVSSGRLGSVHQTGSIKKHLMEKLESDKTAEGNGDNQ